MSSLRCVVLCCCGCSAGGRRCSERQLRTSLHPDAVTSGWMRRVSKRCEMVCDCTITIPTTTTNYYYQVSGTNYFRQAPPTLHPLS